MSKAKSKVRRSPKGLVERLSAKRKTDDIVQWVRSIIEDHEREAQEVLLEHNVDDPGGMSVRRKAAEDRDSADPPYFALKILADCQWAKHWLAELDRTDPETRQASCWLACRLYFVMQHAANIETVEGEHSTITGKKVVEGGQKGVIRAHGTAADRQTKIDGRRDAVSKYEGQRYSKAKAIKAAAKELGCSSPFGFLASRKIAGA